MIIYHVVKKDTHKRVLAIGFVGLALALGGFLYVTDQFSTLGSASIVSVISSVITILGLLMWNVVNKNITKVKLNHEVI